MAGGRFIAKVGREMFWMFVVEMIDDLPDQSKKKKILEIMARITRMTRMARTVALRFGRPWRGACLRDITLRTRLSKNIHLSPDF